jgi:hypothetical protein
MKLMIERTSAVPQTQLIMSMSAIPLVQHREGQAAAVI